MVKKRLSMLKSQ